MAGRCADARDPKSGSCDRGLEEVEGRGWGRARKRKQKIDPRGSAGKRSVPRTRAPIRTLSSGGGGRSLNGAAERATRSFQRDDERGGKLPSLLVSCRVVSSHHELVLEGDVVLHVDPNRRRVDRQGARRLERDRAAPQRVAQLAEVSHWPPGNRLVVVLEELGDGSVRRHARGREVRERDHGKPQGRPKPPSAAPHRRKV